MNLFNKKKEKKTELNVYFADNGWIAFDSDGNFVDCKTYEG